MSKRVLLFGSEGRIGRAMTYAFTKVGWETVQLDKQKGNATKVYGHKNIDLVVSACPFSEGLKLANVAKEIYGVPYFDLGGNPEISSEIQKMMKKDHLSLSGLGLAPGYVNDLIYHHSRKNKNIVAVVGGLPQSVENPLNYSLTFSPEGVYNEYHGKAKSIVDGAWKENDCLDDLIWCDFQQGEETVHTEAFNTRGVIEKLNLKQYKGRSVAYKTMRYHGHCAHVRYLLHEMKMNKEDFVKFLEMYCPPTDKDFVYVSILDVDGGKTLHEQIEYSDQKFTAMQKMTAFHAVAKIFAIFEDRYDPKNVDHLCEIYNKIAGI